METLEIETPTVIEEATTEQVSEPRPAMAAEQTRFLMRQMNCHQLVAVQLERAQRAGVAESVITEGL